MTATRNITIRRTTEDDERSIERLAQRDSAATPTGDLLVAEVDGELWAAVELGTGALIADPFRPSADTAELLGMRARRLHERRRRPWPHRSAGCNPILRRA